MKTAYYVILQDDADLSQPCFIFGYHTCELEDSAPVPPSPTTAQGFKAVHMPDMTQKAWPPVTGELQNRALHNGQIIPTAPHSYKVPLPPLKDQAKAALNDVEKKAGLMTAMGRVFGTTTRDYVQALEAIINGTDTAQTELPAMPDDLTS